MIWSTWSALPFNERTDHHFTICADQDFRFSKDGNSMSWSTWSTLPFTIERTDHHITTCAEQDCPSSKRRKLNDLKHMIGIAFHQWKNWSPLYDLCRSRFSVLKNGNLMIWSTRSALPFANERTDHHFTTCADQDFSFLEVGNSIIWSTWLALPFTIERTDHRFTICAEQDFPLLKAGNLMIRKHMIGIAIHQWKNWSPLYDMCWTRFPSSTDGNSMIWSTLSALPFTNERTDHHFTICADQDFPFSKTETRWFEAQYRHCLSPMKELITTSRYVLNKIFFLKAGTLMTWSTWSALPFTNDRTDHQFMTCADQDCPSSTDGNPMIWSTWSALPFINERTDHHFTICADQDFRFSKTETWWFGRHDRHCLSPMKELNTTLRYVLIKIVLPQ